MKTNYEYPLLNETKPKHPVAAKDPHWLAQWFLENDAPGVMRYWRGEWWLYTDSRYILMSGSELEARLVTSIKKYFNICSVLDWRGNVLQVTRSLVANVRQALAGTVLLPDSVEQNSWLSGESQGSFIALKNGLVDIEAGIAGSNDVLHPHSPDWFSPVQLPYEYDAAAECPRFQAFLEEIFEGDKDRMEVIQQWFGYCLIPNTSLQKCLVLEGEGANGKSVLLEVLTAILGDENVSHVPLEMFGQRFQLTMTLGKLANIASEVGEIDRAAEGVLKEFTAGDRMYFDRKGISGVQARPTARLVLATNNRPKFSDRSGGVWRRIILIPCRVVIATGRQDPKLSETLKGELPGIFNFALRGLEKLRKQERFTESALCREALDEYRIQSNPERQFIEERCRPDTSAATPSSTLYRAYSEWCEEQGRRPADSTVLGKELGRMAKVKRVRLKTPKGREYAYEGIALSQVSQVSQTIYPDEITVEVEDGMESRGNRDSRDKPVRTQARIRHEVAH